MAVTMTEEGELVIAETPIEMLSPSRRSLDPPRWNLNRPAIRWKGGPRRY